MARLSGTGLVADDLYLLAHHEVSGRAHLQPRAIGLGLAGALLAELILSGGIGLRAGRVVVTDGISPQDELASRVLGVVAGEREPRPARDWLAFLARTAAGDVARRLAESGYLTWVCSRRLWQDGRWVPVDADCAFAPLTRARSALDGTRLVSVTGVALAGLATACGLGPRLLPYGPPGGRRCLDGAVRQLAPGLREVIAQTQAAVDTALLSSRM